MKLFANPHGKERKRAPNGYRAVWVRMNGGYCGRVFVKKGRYKFDEYPYDIRRAVICKRAGKHPTHGPAIRARRRGT